jgi:hypothetical protein
MTISDKTMWSLMLSPERERDGFCHIYVAVLTALKPKSQILHRSNKIPQVIFTAEELHREVRTFLWAKMKIMRDFVPKGHMFAQQAEVNN